ncbi:MAG: folylpolyglutamate synthase/dihydrofolate synthase family protein [Pseudomonadota bacterium]
MSTSAAGPLAGWLARLEQLDPSKIDLGLERVTAVLPRLALGDRPLTLTVAGTNGKGTCVTMLDALLRGAGRSVGRYTSPHLWRFNERIAVDGVAVDDATLVEAFDVIERARGATHLTYFEFTTLAALLIFAQQDVDVQVLEIGLGGRLDAVNAIEPDGCLLTNVALDHQRWLGSTTEAIGAEKAAIFRTRRPAVVAAPQPPQSVLDTAARLGADFRLAQRDFHAQMSGNETWEWQGREQRLVGLPFVDSAQLANAAGVFALLESVGVLVTLDETACRDAACLRPPGRLERVSGAPDSLLDVCHNEASVARLAEYLSATPAPAGGRTLVFGAMRDKAIAQMLAPLATLVTRWIAVSATGARAQTADAVAADMARISAAPALVAGSPWQGMQQARRLTPQDGQIVVAGSFPVVGAIRSRL